MCNVITHLLYNVCHVWQEPRKHPVAEVGIDAQVKLGGVDGEADDLPSHVGVTDGECCGAIEMASSVLLFWALVGG